MPCRPAGYVSSPQAFREDFPLENELGPLGEMFASLTQRERDIVRHVLQARANKEIAVSLSCSVKTVEFHLTNIFKKTGVTTRMELISVVLRSNDRTPPRTIF